MNSSKLVIKLYAHDRSADFAAKDVVPVFHAWIQSRAIADHLLIDVADYAHVPDGPGAVLVAHEANYYLDRFDQRLGLTYSRKRPLEGTFLLRLQFAVAAAMEAAALLEETHALAGRLRFRTDRLSLKISDRPLAPNTHQTLAGIRPHLEQFISRYYGDDALLALEHRPDPRRLFEVNICVRPDRAPDVNSLLARLGAVSSASD